jgi:excinuclease ABC subunit B
MKFSVREGLKPLGDQPEAIRQLVEGIEAGEKMQVLQGVTGSGKTMTMAWVVEALQRPTLVMAHNKTLAAQLYREFRELFPNNAIEYFVSYYDYYQPEAYVPASDTFIEKDAKINEHIDRMRHAATRSLLERRDVLIVASVSCIYGIGSAESYHSMLLHLRRGESIKRHKLLHALIELQYERNDIDFHRGRFRVRGDVVEVFPAHEENRAIRIEFWDDEIEAIRAIDPLRGEVLCDLDGVGFYPNSHYVTGSEQLRTAIKCIQEELRERLSELKPLGKLIEYQRLQERTICDIEMLEQFGFCHGIENYSRHLSGRQEGQAPPCLLDYFPKDFLLFVDESHVSLPQIRGMYFGDQSRKRTLVEYGFRLPSALDNRPLRFEEFVNTINQVIFVSATPSIYELTNSARVVEQIVRPTGLLDPQISIYPVANQVDDLLERIRQRVAVGERVLVTTLTKRMAEKLSEYYSEMGIAVRYLHSDIETLERIQLLHQLREGAFDVLIGINLLREGLDLPEVSLVAILDADQQGFLRSASALLQTAGRAARHLRGEVVLYADHLTEAIQTCVRITQRQRAKQIQFNELHGIEPRSIVKELRPFSDTWSYNDANNNKLTLMWAAEQAASYRSERDLLNEIEHLEAEMLNAANKLEFETAAKLRDQIHALRQIYLLQYAEKSDIS